MRSRRRRLLQKSDLLVNPPVLAVADGAGSAGSCVVARRHRGEGVRSHRTQGPLKRAADVKHAATPGAKPRCVPNTRKPPQHGKLTARG